MGSYIFGNKEIYYLDKIKSRNFVAIFHTSPRLDGMGVTFEHGGINNNMKLHKLDSIQLFSEAMYNSTSTQKSPSKQFILNMIIRFVKTNRIHTVHQQIEEN